jgi:hypothetical protein
MRKLTGSRCGKEILDSWAHFQPMFWKVAPHSAMAEEGPMTIIQRHFDSTRVGPRSGVADLSIRSGKERCALSSPVDLTDRAIDINIE